MSWCRCRWGVSASSPGLPQPSGHLLGAGVACVVQVASQQRVALCLQAEAKPALPLLGGASSPCFRGLCLCSLHGSDQA